MISNAALDMIRDGWPQLQHLSLRCCIGIGKCHVVHFPTMMMGLTDSMECDNYRNFVSGTVHLYRQTFCIISREVCYCCMYRHTSP